MVPAIDVKHINPFLQSSISIVESVTQVKLTVGKPEMTDFHLHDKYYAIQVGELDEMASSALNELGNMIMGNTATIFSTLGIIIDITPPLAVYGNDLQLKSDIDGIKVPLMYGGEEYIGLYICVYEDK